MTALEKVWQGLGKGDLVRQTLAIWKVYEIIQTKFHLANHVTRESKEGYILYMFLTFKSRFSQGIYLTM